MCLRLTWLGWLRFAKVGTLAQVVVVQLRFESFIGGLGKHALLFEDGEQTHGLSHGRGEKENT